MNFRFCGWQYSLTCRQASSSNAFRIIFAAAGPQSNSSLAAGKTNVICRRSAFNNAVLIETVESRTVKSRSTGQHTSAEINVRLFPMTFQSYIRLMSDPVKHNRRWRQRDKLPDKKAPAASGVPRKGRAMGPPPNPWDKSLECFQYSWERTFLSTVALLQHHHLLVILCLLCTYVGS